MLRATALVCIAFIVPANGTAQEKKDASYWESWLLEEDWRRPDSRNFERGLSYFSEHKAGESFVKVLGRYDKLVKESEAKGKPKNDLSIAVRKRRQILVAMRFACNPELGKKHPHIADLYVSQLENSDDFIVGSSLLALGNLGPSASPALPQIREWLDRHPCTTNASIASTAIKKIEAK